LADIGTTAPRDPTEAGEPNREFSDMTVINTNLSALTAQN
jgi:hypothetical protein